MGAVDIYINACDDGGQCWNTKSATNTKGTNLLSMIKDALIGKTYALARQLPEGISAIYYNINDEGRQTYTG
jgi:hypothetical protein